MLWVQRTGLCHWPAEKATINGLPRSKRTASSQHPSQPTAGVLV